MGELELLIEELGNPKAINNIYGYHLLLEIAIYNKYPKV